MHELFLIFSGIAIGSLLLIIFKLIKDCRGLPGTVPLIFLLLGGIAYVLLPSMSVHPGLTILLNVGSMTVAVFFWFFTAVLFKSRGSEFRLKFYHYLCMIGVVVLGTLQCTSQLENPSDSLLYYVLLAANTLFVCLGLSNVWRNWQYDLVECRRMLRMSLSTITGILVLIALVDESLSGAGVATGPLTYLNILFLSIFALFEAYWILIGNPNGLLESVDDVPIDLVPASRKEAPFLSVSDQTWLDALEKCMEQDYYYRRHDLTIRNLAGHLSIPEHHLRRLINQHLGFRNFNDYLNRYRVREAADRLQDPQLARLPILTIAIESGYASLTPFNKAFKALKEMTPSEFRRT